MRVGQRADHHLADREADHEHGHAELHETGVGAQVAGHLGHAGQVEVDGEGGEGAERAEQQHQPPSPPVSYVHIIM